MGVVQDYSVIDGNPINDCDHFSSQMVYVMKNPSLGQAIWKCRQCGEYVTFHRVKAKFVIIKKSEMEPQLSEGIWE